MLVNVLSTSLYFWQALTPTRQATLFKRTEAILHASLHCYIDLFDVVASNMLFERSKDSAFVVLGTGLNPCEFMRSCAK